MNELQYNQVFNLCLGMLKDVIAILKQSKNLHADLINKPNVVSKNLHSVKGFLYVCKLYEIGDTVENVELMINQFKKEDISSFDLKVLLDILDDIVISIETVKMGIVNDKKSLNDDLNGGEFDAIVCMNNPSSEFKAFLLDRGISYIKRPALNDIYHMNHQLLENKLFIFSPDINGVPATYSIHILNKFVKNSIFAIVVDHESDKDKMIPIMPLVNFSCFSLDSRRFSHFMADFIASKYRSVMSSSKINC